MSAAAEATLAGSCLCGAIAFEVTAPPLSMGHCHCSMCRRQHGTAFGTYVEVPRAAFRYTRGAEHVAGYVSSPGITRRFCARCGSKLVFDMDGNADTVSVAAGAFDSPLPLVPQYHIFVASKAPWHGIHDALPRFDAYPPDDA